MLFSALLSGAEDHLLHLKVLFPDYWFEFSYTHDSNLHVTKNLQQLAQTYH